MILEEARASRDGVGAPEIHSSRRGRNETEAS